jgi:DNA repair protein RadA/Sms
VGLGGEVRGASRVVERLKEAAKLGFRRAVLPAGNTDAVPALGLELHPVRNLAGAISLLRQDPGQ